MDIETNASLFNGYKDNKVINNFPLSSWVLPTKEDTDLINTVMLIRSFTLAAKCEKKQQFKQIIKIKDLVKTTYKPSLPAITPSLQYRISGKRGTKTDIIKHTGFIQYDIDFKENKHISNYSELKEQIKKIPEIVSCMLSVSGNGYWGLVAISDTSKHLQHFQALERAFKSVNIIIDSACKDVGRLRGYSYDEDPYINEKAKVFTATYEPPKQKQYKQKKHTYSNSKNIYNNTTRFESCLSKIQAQNIDITGDYPTWLKLAYSIASEFGTSGNQYFHAISQYHSGYNNNECEKLYNNVAKGNINKIDISLFFKICKANNISFM